MAATLLLLSPTFHILERPQKLSILYLKHLHRQQQRRLLARGASSTAPIRRRRRRIMDQSSSSENHQVSTKEYWWSFEQRLEEALNVLELMEAQGMEAEPSLICILLKSCADAENLEFGKTIHSKIVGSRLEKDDFVVNNLINMYAKCGSFETARKLFDKMPLRNAVSWTTIISMYSQSGFHEEALRLYSAMKSAARRRVRPTAFTYTIALNSCTKTGNLNMGIEIHEDIKKDGCEDDTFIVTALIDFYSKCDKIDRARRIFDMIDKPPKIATCTAMIDGYNTNNQSKEAMSLIRKMILRSGSDMEVAKELGFTCMIRSCIVGTALRQGQEIHAHMIKFGYQLGGQTLTSLILMYEKCDRMGDARRLFDELLVRRSVGLWGSMITGYVRNGLNQVALELYFKMVCEDVEPNPLTLSSALNACIDVLGLKEGKEIHGRTIKAGLFGLFDDSLVVNLAKFYREFELFEDVQKVTKYHRNQR